MTSPDWYELDSVEFMNNILAHREYIEDLIQEWPSHLERHDNDPSMVIASLVVNLVVKEKATDTQLAGLFAVAVSMLYDKGRGNV